MVFRYGLEHSISLLRSEAFRRRGRGDGHPLPDNLRRQQSRPGVEKIRLPRDQRQMRAGERFTC